MKNYCFTRLIIQNKNELPFQRLNRPHRNETSTCAQDMHCDHTIQHGMSISDLHLSTSTVKTYLQYE